MPHGTTKIVYNDIREVTLYSENYYGLRVSGLGPYMILSYFSFMISRKILNSLTFNVFISLKRMSLYLFKAYLIHCLDLHFDYNLIWHVICGVNVEKSEGDYQHKIQCIWPVMFSTWVSGYF